MMERLWKHRSLCVLPWGSRATPLTGPTPAFKSTLEIQGHANNSEHKVTNKWTIVNNNHQQVNKSGQQVNSNEQIVNT